MKLQIRTKDNLEDLLRHRNSPSWVISESRIHQIEEVEIYQFDGKKVIKGTFDIDNSSRTESGRLIVAFKNAHIEDCAHKWIGQNPIKYDSIKNTIDNENMESLNLLNENAKPHLISFNEGTIEDIDTFIDFLINKIEITTDFIKKRIDDKLLGFILFDFDYDNLKQLPDFASIDNSDLRNLLKNNINLDLIKYSISVQDLRPKLVFIFDPKDSELAIWKEEFLDLSSILDLKITIFGDNNEYCDIVYQQYDCGNWEEGIVACDQGYMEDLSANSYCYSENQDDFPDKLFFKIETYINNIITNSTSESNEIKIGFYAGKNNDDNNNEECCNAGDQPDYILLGGFQKRNGKNEFVGRVITNWCDKYPTDSLMYNGQSVIDSGGVAEDEDGHDLWEDVSNEFPNLLNEINSLYEYLEIDEDDEHYNLSSEIPDEIRLFNLYEGYYMDIQDVEKGNGEKLGIEFYL